MVPILSITFLLFILSCILADDHTHKYKDAEEVTLWMNKVGPYNNPQETYAFYSLPFCKPDASKEIRYKSHSLGVQLEGSQLVDSGIRAHFKDTQKLTTICQLEMDEVNVEIFSEAVKNHYWYQLYIDELPIWGMVGEHVTEMPIDMVMENKGKQSYIYTHKDFSIAYNRDQIIEVNLTSGNPRPIVAGKSLPMTLSITWVPTSNSFPSRFDRYLDFDFFEHQIHWFSIFNSFMMVVFLIGAVAVILMRTLRNDYSRYTSEDDDLEMDRVIDESGWKQVHGDVFRAPKRLVLYASLVGTGYQLFFLAFCVITMTFVGSFYDERGAIITTFLVCHSLTSFIAGYAGGGFYKRNGGQHWKQCMLLTACLFPGLCFSIVFILNCIAMSYQSLQAISVSSLMLMGAIWLFVACPLLLLGTIVGRSTAQPGDFPCRVNNIHRPIPNGKWYTQPVTLSLLTGILPFGSIFIEVYFIFTSFWNYKFYYVYGFMFLVYCILIIVTVCVSIVSTYFFLSAEDYRWHWTTFFSGGSTALYVFLYGVYYFYTKTRMSGLLQTSFYFGYLGLFSIGLFILCGTIGYMGTNIFIRRIYEYIKSD